MAQPNLITSDTLFQANFGVTGTLTTPWTQSQIKQRDAKEYVVPLTDLRVWDAFQTNLPGTAATDDLALIGGTFGTASPTVRSSDADNTTIQQFARFIYSLPYEYVAGQTITLRIHAGVNTSVASASATVDVVAHRMDSTAGIGSDLCSTAAQSINSTTNANKDFTITPATLGPGDAIDVRVVIAITDTATATAVIGEIGSLTFLCDVQG